MSEDIISLDVDIEAIRTAAIESSRRFREIETAAMEAGDTISEEMKKAFEDSKKEATSYAQRYAKELSNLEKENEKHAKNSVESLKKPFDEASKKFDTLESVMGSLNLPFAGIFGTLKEMNSALGDSVENTGDANFGAVKLGVAFGVAAGAALAVGTAAISIGAAIVSAVGSAAAFNDELSAFSSVEGFEPISGAALSAIERGGASLDAIGVVLKKISMEVGTAFAPLIERASTLIVAFGIAAADAFKSFGSGGEILRSIAVYATETLVKALLHPVSILMEVVNLVSRASRAVGQIGIAEKLEQVTKGYDNWVKSVSETTVDFYFDKASDSVSNLEKSHQGLIDRAKKLIGVQTELNVATREYSKDASKKAEDSSKRQAEATKRQTEELNKLKEAALGIANEGMTPAELAAKKYTLAIDTLGKAISKGLITSEQFRLGVLGSAKALREASEEAVKPDLFANPFGAFSIDTEIKAPEFSEEPSWFSKISDVTSSLSEGFGTAFGMAGQVFGIFQSLAEQSPEQIQSMVKGFEKVLSSLPKLLKSLVKALPDIIPDLVDALVTVLQYLATDGIPILMDMALSFITAIIENLPELIPSLINAAGSFIGAIIGAIPDIIVVLVKMAPSIVVAIIRGLLAAVIQIIAGILDAIGLDSAAKSLRKFAKNMSGGSGGSKSSGNTSTSNSGTGYKSEQQTSKNIDATDAYIPASGQSQTVTTTPGDATLTYQQGGVNDLSTLLKGILMESVRANRLREEGNKLLNKIYNKDSGSITRSSTPAKSQR